MLAGLCVPNILFLRLTQGVIFSCNTVWQFYVLYSVAVLRITQGGSFLIVQGGRYTYRVGVLRIFQSGSFTSNTVWQFYI